MELLTHTIHTNKINCHSDMQITLEDDMNVPDTKPDIETLVKTGGAIQISSITPSDGKVNIHGALSFSLLYLSNDDIRPVHNMTGQIQFDESVNMDNISATDSVTCHLDLEDCQANLINSRKVNIKAIISIHCCQTEDTESSIGTDIVSEDASRADMDTYDTPAGLHKKYKNMSFTDLVLQRNDIFRINDELTLPKGKPDVETILYYEMTPLNLQTRIVDDGLRLVGDINLFILYIPESEERKLEYIETEIPFDGIVNCNGCTENMVPDIETSIDSKDISVKPDEDGEARIFDIELALKLQMKFYEDQELQILSDAYSTACELSLNTKNIDSEKLLMKNQSSLRISNHIKIEDGDNILQICNTSGSIQIDEHEITDDGIKIEGAVELDILYMTENDSRPLSMAKGLIPFSHIIEIKDISPTDTYELQSDINQINAIMIDSEEVEVKIVLALCAIVFSNSSEKYIASISENPLDLEKLHKLPGLVGFIADHDMNIWDIAKNFSTTPESITELNNLETDEVHKGDKLLLLKMVDGI